ncbi:MAG: 3-deoxy-7-phosphoheptulonate synthase, partial [Clostridiales bacterium]|nr:3-deoxy-7-phosphoheptulonate synthase [Clostridiales bacterium]
MIVILKDGHDKEQLQNLESWLKGQGLSIQVNYGCQQTVLGLIG